MFWKAFLVGLLIALGEVINGNVRVRFLHRKFGKKRAQTISFFSGLTIIFAICWITLPWLEPEDYTECLMVGSIWLIIMMGLDIYFGRYVFKLKWNRIAEDFNPKKGNLLGIGMVVLFWCPTMVFFLQH